MRRAEGLFGVWSCATCGKTAPATVHQMRKTYCSSDCMAKGYAVRLVGAANPNFRDAGRGQCAQCGGDFQSYMKRQKYCSSACYHESRQLPPKPPKPPRAKKVRPVKPPREIRSARSNCINCGTEFTYYLSRPKFSCSYACHLASGGALRAGLAASKAIMKYGTKKDANHNEVVEEMQKYCAVYDLSSVGRGIPDGLAWIDGSWHLFDVKNPKTSYGKKGLNPIQTKWIQQWKGGPVWLIYTADEAKRFATGKFDGLKAIGA